MKKLVIGIPCGKKYNDIIANIAGYGVTDCLIDKLSNDLDQEKYIAYDSINYIEYDLSEKEMDYLYGFPEVVVVIEAEVEEEESKKIVEHEYSILRNELRDIIFERKYTIVKGFIGKDYYYDLEQITMYDDVTETREHVLIKLAIRMEVYINHQLDDILVELEIIKKAHPNDVNIDEVIEVTKELRNDCYMFKPLARIATILVKTAKRYSAIDQRPTKVFNNLIKLNNSTLTIQRSIAEITKMKNAKY